MEVGVETESGMTMSGVRWTKQFERRSDASALNGFPSTVVNKCAADRYQ